VQRRVPNSNKIVLARKSERPPSAVDVEEIPDTSKETAEVEVELKPCIVQIDSKQVCFFTSIPSAAF
jgi:hypothetical protein